MLKVIDNIQPADDGSCPRLFRNAPSSVEFNKLRKRLLRPLSLCAEADLEKFARLMRFPIIPCNLCGSQDGLQRNLIKQMLNDIESRMPGRKDSMIRALANVRPSHLLDPKLFDFSKLGVPVPHSDAPQIRR